MNTGDDHEYIQDGKIDSGINASDDKKFCKLLDKAYQTILQRKASCAHGWRRSGDCFHRLLANV